MEKEASGEPKAEIVGRITDTYRFQGMVDFQFLLPKVTELQPPPTSISSTRRWDAYSIILTATLYHCYQTNKKDEVKRRELLENQFPQDSYVDRTNRLRWLLF